MQTAEATIRQENVKNRQLSEYYSVVKIVNNREQKPKLCSNPGLAAPPAVILYTPGDPAGVERDEPDAVPVFVGQVLCANRARVRGGRDPKNCLLVREFGAVVGRLAVVPGVPLDEAQLIRSDPTRGRRHFVSSDVDPLLRHGVDRNAGPDVLALVLYLEVVRAILFPMPFEGTGHACTPICAVPTIRVGGGSARDEAREHAMKDG